jgi:hypothetical protein
MNLIQIEARNVAPSVSSDYLRSVEFAAKAPLYRTARALIGCAQFKAGDFVAVRFHSKSAHNGTVWFEIDRSEHGALKTVTFYPAHHLSEFCL